MPRLLEIIGLSCAGLALLCATPAAAQVPQPFGADDIARLRSICGVLEGATPAPVIDGSSFADLGAALVHSQQEHQGEIILVGGQFPGADLGAVPSLPPGTCFVDTDFQGSDWTRTNGRELTFVRADLAGADFSQAQLSGARFIGSNASGASFANANLAGGAWIGRYSGSNLEGADFTNADLGDFRFECGITMDEACGGNSGVDFSGANLSGAHLTSFPIYGFDGFDGAKLDRTHISPRAIRYLEGIEVAGPVILGWAPDGSESSYPDATVTPQEFEQLRTSALSVSRDVPAFDCAKAGNPAEKVICGEYESELRVLDRDMTAIYEQALEQRQTSRQEQRNWLLQRNFCTDRDCLIETYRIRKAQLMAAMGAQVSLAPDATMQFDEDVLPVDASMRGSALYRRLVPAMRSVSRQSVTLTGREDGSIAATGVAVGGNAHLCSLSVESAIYDPYTAWYVGVGEGGVRVPLFRVWQGALEFRYSGNMGDTPDAAGDFITCGARAGFGNLVALGD